MKRSFRLFVTTTILVVQTTTLSVLGYYLYRKNEQLLRDEFFVRIEQVNQTLGTTLGPLVHTLPESELQTLLEKIRAENKIRYLFLRTPNRSEMRLGQTLEDAVSLENLQDRQEKLKILDHFVAVPGLHTHDEDSELQIGYDFTPLERSLKDFKEKSIFGLLGQIFILGSVTALLLQILFRRLEALQRACEKVSTGEYDVQVNDPNNDEIGAISKAFDAMTLAIRTSLEEQERHRISMIEASRLSSLGTMAGGIAHEINTPLSVIQLTAEKMIRALKLPEPDREKLTESAETIRSVVFRISKIIQGLRSFARSGQEGATKTEERLAALIDDVLSLGAEKIRTSGIQLKIETIKDPTIKIDKVRIGQVFLNLINNAVDAVESLEERWIRIRIEEDHGKAMVYIQDSGKGISQDIRDKIMTPFFTTKPVGKGTGLGLSISRGILHDHGGDLYYIEKDGHTTFMVVLPVNG